MSDLFAMPEASTSIGAASAPVHLLPFDILSPIFVTAVTAQCTSLYNSFRLPSYYHWVWALRLVCRRWKAFVDASAGLWAYVALTDPPAVVRMAFQNSGGFPLTVDWTGLFNGGEDFRQRTPDLLEIRSMLPAHMSHVKALRFEVPVGYNAPDRAILMNAAPMLEELCIDGGQLGMIPSVTAEQLFANIAPRLSRVAITRTSMRLDAMVLSDLEELDLNFPRLNQNTVPVPFQHLLDALTRSPTLKTLKISGGDLGHPLHPIDPSNVVRLERLERLELAYGGANRSFLDILSYIHAPNCSTMIRLDAHSAVAMHSAILVQGFCNAVGPGDLNLQFLPSEHKIQLGRATIYLQQEFTLWHQLLAGLTAHVPVAVSARVHTIILDWIVPTEPAMVNVIMQPRYAHIEDVSFLVTSSLRSDRIASLDGFTEALCKSAPRLRVLPGMRTLRLFGRQMDVVDLSRIVEIATRRWQFGTPLQAVNIELRFNTAGPDWDIQLVESRKYVHEVTCIISSLA